MEFLITPILCSFMLVVFILGVLYVNEQRDMANTELVKIIQQAGGSNITVEKLKRPGTQGVLHFVVNYVDIDGEYQTRQVTRSLNFWGSLTGDFHWDKPVKTTSDNGRLASKEQIISDMDAEIKRLQEELVRAKKGSE